MGNDGEANQLWMNQKNGTFRDTAFIAGAAVSGAGNAEASMGIDAGDFDNDGDEDLFVTNWLSQMNVLYVNDGTGVFEDRRAAAGLGAPSLAKTGFGTAWFDFDNDGWLDLLAVNGTELLVLERAFIRMRGTSVGVNAIRLYRISLDRATDVSTFPSLAGRDGITPVRKTLVQDFSQLSGRSLRLINLENFEGLAWVGEGADRRLLVVSDDNFNPLQVTAFLLLEPAAASKRAPICP